MINKNLINKVQYFYKKSIKLSDRNIFYFSNGDEKYVSIYKNGELSANVYLYPYTGNLKINNPDVTSIPFEIKQLVATNAVDAILIISACWKLFGPIIPDAVSLTDQAISFITNYFNRFKDDSNLIKKISIKKKESPYNSIYYPNSQYISQVESFNIQEVEDEWDIQNYITEADELFFEKSL